MKEDISEYAVCVDVRAVHHDLQHHVTSKRAEIIDTRSSDAYVTTCHLLPSAGEFFVFSTCTYSI